MNTVRGASAPIAITMGDPAGSGPEIIARAYAQAPELTRGSFVAGDLECMRRGARIAAGGQPPLPIARIESVAEAADVPPRCIPLRQTGATVAS